MKRGYLIIITLVMSAISMVLAQSPSLDDIIEDIYNQLSENGDIPLENIQEELIEIANNPINLNHTTADELSKLQFLSDEQIDAILLYQYQHPFQEIYELQLINCLKDYEIRNLLPFVYVGKVEEQQKIYFREIFHYAKHEITLRTDARNIEDFDTDPIYAKLRYRFNYQNKVQAGITIARATGAMWKNIDYGAYIQIRDLGPMKSIVAGNYQASFGYGLVVGSPFRRGKTAYIQSTTSTDEGLKKYSSVGDSYNYFHGLGATAKISKWADISAFYSIQEEDEQWQHVVGVNATGRWKNIKLGLTAIENIISDSSQAVIGVNARWNQGKVDIWGELATSQGEKWGVGGIAGVRYTPLSDFNILAIYRYYSPYFHNTYANSLCSHTKINNEHAGYLGLEFNRLKYWQLSALADIWKTGFETMLQANYIPQKNYNMHTRFRVKRKSENDTYSIRWNMVYSIGQWKMKTQVDGNIVNEEKNISYGWSILQDVEYHFIKLPIVMQMRAQAFDAREWNNRVYIYENDVLYAYAIPFVYGFGGRFWINARYKINDIFSLYMRVSETIYQHAWALKHNKKSTRTDVHALLRVKL